VAEIAGDQTYLRHGVEVGEGAVVLDVGANVGVSAAFFALECGAGLVHCFEPVPAICAVLRENVADLPACVVHEAGMSSRAVTGEIAFYPGAMAMSSQYADPERDRALVRAALLNLGVAPDDADARLAGRYRPEIVSCRLTTVSDVLREEGLARVDLLKIDVERAELDVLNGVAAADWPRIEQVVVEVHDEGGRGALVERMLAGQGFRVTGEQEDAMHGTSVRMIYARRP
jgi:FkbM family methyltransferase